ncbi:MAG: oligosaccharide flippase family protein [Magnetospirillum sp.]|nr:oligosaccharide flippase family protein [Magnetospirillum sp.]
MAELRRLACQGGLTMALRQLLGMGVSFVGLIALARLIGPQTYGVFVSAFALHSFLVMFFQWGTDVFLVRRPEDPDAVHVAQALALALVLGGAGMGLAWPVGKAAEAWIGAPGIAQAVTTLFCGMPLQLAALVPSAVLQRRMAYRAVAVAEMAGQVALYGIAVAAAWAGWGLTAPLAGWWAQQMVMAALLFGQARLPFTLTWRRELLRELLGYGLGFSASLWIWHLRSLVNPLVVARLLGPEAAAGVAVAVRLVDGLSFMRIVLWRVALPALGRIQADRGRLARAVAEGTRLQVLAVGPLLVVFSAAAPWLVPLAFGRDWTPAAAVFPFLALASLVNTVFSLSSAALAVVGANAPVARFHALHVAILAAAALVLVPRFGLTGYGLAEAAALISYPALYRSATLRLGGLGLGAGVAWAAGFALALFAGSLGPLAWAGPAVVAVLPETRRTLATWWEQWRALRDG